MGIKIMGIKINIPAERIKKVREEVIARVERPEEVMPLNDGAELILKEGSTIELTETTYRIEHPIDAPKLSDGRERK